MSRAIESGNERISATPLLLLGVATGILSGLLGIGGGVVMVPVLVSIGFSRHKANATSLATIFLVALAGAIGFAVSGSVDVPVGTALGVGGLVGATLGARWAHRMSGQALARLFGFLLLAVGIRMLLGSDPLTFAAGVRLPWSLLIAVAVGVGTGVLSGMAGVGGGIVLVPAMVFLLGLSQHLAEGTSLLAILFMAAAGTKVNRANRYVVWRPVFLLAMTGVVAAPVAALFAQQIPGETLAKVFAVWLLYTALSTLWRARPRGRGRDTRNDRHSGSDLLDAEVTIGSGEDQPEGIDADPDPPLVTDKAPAKPEHRVTAERRGRDDPCAHKAVALDDPWQESIPPAVGGNESFDDSYAIGPLRRAARGISLPVSPS